MTTIRMSGLASELDTEAIIKTLVEAKEVPIKALEEKIADNKELYSTWTEIDTGLSLLKSDASQLTSYTNWQQKTVTSTYDNVVSGATNSFTAATGTYEIDVTTLAVAHRYHSDAQAGTKTALGYDGVFSINGEEITVTSDDTIESLVTKINTAATSMGTPSVKASIIGTSLVIESSVTGTGSDISMSYVSGDDVLNGLNMFAHERVATDLNATIDGVGVSAKKNTGITTFISGLTLTFAHTGSADLTVARDTSSLKTFIDDFITGYNTMMGYMKDYTAMNSAGGDDNGLLQGDMLANNIQSKSRLILTSINKNPGQMNQDFNTLYKVGIWFKDKDNEISIVDEDKLTNALENNFEEVEALFRGYGSSNGGKGVLRQFEEYYNTLLDPTEGSITVRTNSLTADKTRMNERLAKMKLDLIDYETDLWLHFTAMETMVNSIKSQGKYVFSNLGIKDDN